METESYRTETTLVIKSLAEEIPPAVSKKFTDFRYFCPERLQRKTCFSNIYHQVVARN